MTDPRNDAIDILITARRELFALMETTLPVNHRTALEIEAAGIRIEEMLERGAILSIINIDVPCEGCGAAPNQPCDPTCEAIGERLNALDAVG